MCGCTGGVVQAVRPGSVAGGGGGGGGGGMVMVALICTKSRRFGSES